MAASKKSAESTKPQAKPSVVKSGSGKDTKYTDTRTGKSYAAPSYSPLSFKGFTSTDPANVARNQYAAQMYRDRASSSSGGGGSGGGFGVGTGIASLPGSGTGIADGVQRARTPQELASLGASNAPMAPIFVAPPRYTAYDELSQLGPGSYAQAFMGGNYNYPSFGDDIFTLYPYGIPPVSRRG